MGREGRRDLMPRPPAVARVLERVTRTAREHEMFAPGDRVLVSVSGGPDSVALLHFLAQERENLTGNARDLWPTGTGTMRGQAAALSDLERKVASGGQELRQAVASAPIRSATASP